MPSSPAPPLRLGGKLRLAMRVWLTYVRVRVNLRRRPLPAAVRILGQTDGRSSRHPPRLLSRAVHRSLHLGPLRPRCLTSSLVLYRLLREQGDEPEVVIGLPPEARDHDAHAWVELGSRDIGPPPGRGRHAPFARFP